MSTLSQQVELVEKRLSEARRERDDWMRLHALECDKRNAAESRLAQARVEGAREALTRYCWSDGGVSHRLTGGGECEHHANGNCLALRFRDREYPAVPEGVDGFTGHAATSGTFSQTVCVIPNCDCAHAHPTPTPEREGYEGPIVALSLTEMSDGGEKLLITPALASRIVSLAAQDGGSDA